MCVGCYSTVRRQLTGSISTELKGLSWYLPGHGSPAAVKRGDWMKFEMNKLRGTILYRMEELQLTYEKLAERADVSPECIRNLTCGKVKKPTIDTFMKIMNALELDVMLEARIK